MAIQIKKTKQGVCATYIAQAFTNSLNFQRPNFIKFNEWYRIYRGIRDDSRQNYAGRANLFIPYVFSVIETIIPRLVGNNIKVEAIPREPNDLKKAKVNNALMDYQWDKMNMRAKLKSWLRQAMSYGYGMMKLTWQFKEGEMDMPNAEMIDLFDVFYDPNGTTVDNCRYIIHRAERSLEELKKNPNYTVPKDLDVTVQQDEYKVQRDAILGLTKPKDKDSKKIEVLEYWGLYDLGEGEEECLIVVANKNILLRAEPNPYQHKRKPFIKLMDIEDISSFAGIGEIEQLASLQYELNDIRNQRMDNVTLILNRMWKVNKNAGVDESDLVSQAGQVIHCDDMNGIEPLETQDVTGSSYNEETLVKSDMQLISGVNDYTRGGGGGTGKGEAGTTNETATGIMLLQEAAASRFKYKLDNLEDSLKEFGEQLLGLNQQFVDKATKIRIVGEGLSKWIDVEPEEMQGDFDLEVDAASDQPMNKSIRRAEARELLQAVIPFAQLGIDIKYFITYLLETYDLTDVEKAFPAQGPGLPGGIPGSGGQIPGAQGAGQVPGMGGSPIANPGTQTATSVPIG